MFWLWLVPALLLAVVGSFALWDEATRPTDALWLWFRRPRDRWLAVPLALVLAAAWPFVFAGIAAWALWQRWRTP